MLFLILQLLFIVLYPLVAIFLSKRFRICSLLGPVILCYAAGIVLANLPLVNINMELSQKVTDIVIPLAIPLLLFSADFFKWLRVAKTTLISFLLTVVSIVVASTMFAPIFASYHPESWKIAGMLVGVYTGGTPNMASIGKSVIPPVTNETYLLVNAADVVIAGIYLIFLMTIAKPLLKRFYPPFKAQEHSEPSPNSDNLPTMSLRAKLGEGFVALSLSILIFVGSVELSILASAQNEIVVPIVMLTLTSLGIACSFVRKIRNLKYSYPIGDYLILIFCVAIGTVTQFKNLFAVSMAIFAYCALVMTTAIVVHYVLAMLLKIDLDTVIITSTAAIYGPAFIGVIAEAIRNKQVILSGLTMGLLGYAVGNYLGLLVALICKMLQAH